MDTRLTLKLEEGIILKAKKYARSHGESLSKLVETFLHSLTDSETAQEEKLPPVVKSLAGIIKGKKSIDTEKYNTDFLMRKYR